MSELKLKQFIEDLKKNQNLFEEKALNKNEIVFKEGERGEEFYLIEEGEVGIYKIADSNTGEEKELARLKNGNCFGESALFDNQVRLATVRAIKETKLLIINREKLFSFLMKEPETALSFLLNLLHLTNLRLQQMNEQLLLLYDIGKILAKNKKNLDLLSAEVLKKIIEVSWGEKGALFIKEPYNEEFVPKASFDRAFNQMQAEVISDLGKLIWEVKEGKIRKEQDYVAIIINDIDERKIGAVVLRTDAEIGEERLRLVLLIVEQLGPVLGESFSYQDKVSKEKLERKYIGM